MYDEALRDLRSLYRGEVSPTGWMGGARKDDVIRWAELSGLDAGKVLDQVAIGLARDYAAGIITWEFCDRAANDLFHAMMELQIADEAEQFWKFYLAFDHSETFSTLIKAEEVARDEIGRFLKTV